MKTVCFPALTAEAALRRGVAMDPKELNIEFFSLISMLASACWQQLGKTPNQETGTVNKDLKGAKSTIDILLMIRDKTQGNLTGTEEKLLCDTIASLQKNYAEEAGD